VLGDGDPAMRLAVTVLFVDETRRWREEHRLLQLLDVREVEVCGRRNRHVFAS
jgi:hypothetical protein